REFLLALEALSQRFAFHVRHDIVDQAARLAGIEQRQDGGAAGGRWPGSHSKSARCRALRRARGAALSRRRGDRASGPVPDIRSPWLDVLPWYVEHSCARMKP